MALMLATVAWSIQDAEWAAGLSILTPIVIGGVVAGAVLGAQRWLPATIAHGWSLVLGFLGTFYLATFVLTSYTDAAVLAELTRFEQMELVRDWLWQWIHLAADDALASNPDLARFVFVLDMAFLLWLVSYVCTWFLVRYVSWWGAVLPSGFALLLNLYAEPNPPVHYLAVYLLCAFLLSVQVHLALQEERWREQRIPYSPDIGLDFLRDGLVIALVVIAFGWLAPPELGRGQLQSVLQRVTGASNPVQNQFNRLFPSLNYPVRGGGNSFGQNMPLGGSISLGTRPIFDARVEGEVVPRYWRLAAFDTYTGQTWRRSAEETLRAEASSSALARSERLRAPVTQTIKTFQGETVQLPAAPQPVQFSLPIEAELSNRSALDVLAVDSTEPLPVGGSYQAVSAVSVADVESLRAAPADDPDWVRQDYLQLPAVPDRVTELAAALTADAGNRFDAARAIEDHLRRIPYSETISSPPAERDLVDWFLFDERQGYCDYYASSFVVLARAAGIPARLAAGYSQGDFIEASGTFRQREYDAHTWPEVYFPAYGWVEFEPTAADAPIARASSLDDPAMPDVPEEVAAPERDEMLPEEDLLDAQEPIDLFDRQDPAAGGRATLRLWPILGALALLAALGAVAAVVWQRPLRGLSAAEGAYARLARVASWLGLRPDPSETPHEYGTRLTAAIPEGEREISTITDAYVRERYSRRAPAGSTARRAWAALRRQLPRAVSRLGLSGLRERLRRE